MCDITKYDPIKYEFIHEKKIQFNRKMVTQNV